MIRPDKQNVLDALSVLGAAVAVWLALIGASLSFGQDCDLNAKFRALLHTQLQAAVQPKAEPFGYFVLQPGDTPKRAITEAQLRLPNVVGLTIRVRRSWIWKNGQYDFSFIQQCVDRCHKTGDGYTILVMGGETAQPWSEANLKFYLDAAQVLGWRFDSDPLCAGVHITGCSPMGVSEELHWPRPMSNAVIAANKKLIDAWTKAFPTSHKLLAISGKDPAACQQLIDYGTAKGEGLFLVKHNSLKSNTNLAAAHNQLVAKASKRGARPGFEMVGPAVDVQRFGPGGIMAGIGKGRRLLQDAGYTDLNKTYYAVYSTDLARLK
jgi:hypothetical protein